MRRALTTGAPGSPSGPPDLTEGRDELLAIDASRRESVDFLIRASEADDRADHFVS